MTDLTAADQYKVYAMRALLEMFADSKGIPLDSVGLVISSMAGGCVAIKPVVCNEIPFEKLLPILQCPSSGNKGAWIS